MRFARAFTQSIELSSLYVRLELAIPNFGIEQSEPPAKGRKLVRRKALNLALEVIDFAHDLVTVIYKLAGNYTLAVHRSLLKRLQ